jgi:hypothetical protein
VEHRQLLDSTQDGRLLNSQDTTPVHANDEDSKTSTVQEDPNPIEVEEKLLGKLLTMQHTESRWICHG